MCLHATVVALASAPGDRNAGREQQLCSSACNTTFSTPALPLPHALKACHTRISRQHLMPRINKQCFVACCCLPFSLLTCYLPPYTNEKASKLCLRRARCASAACTFAAVLIVPPFYSAIYLYTCRLNSGQRFRTFVATVAAGYLSHGSLVLARTRAAAIASPCGRSRDRRAALSASPSPTHGAAARRSRRAELHLLSPPPPLRHLYLLPRALCLSPSPKRTTAWVCGSVPFAIEKNGWHAARHRARCCFRLVARKEECSLLRALRGAARAAGSP